MAKNNIFQAECGWCGKIIGSFSKKELKVPVTCTHCGTTQKIQKRNTVRRVTSHDD